MLLWATACETPDRAGWRSSRSEGEAGAVSAAGPPDDGGAPARRSDAVLDPSDDERFASLRKPTTSRQERYAQGRSIRQKVPRSALARWRPAADRLDPVQQVRTIHEGRLERLLPIRVGRMIDSP